MVGAGLAAADARVLTARALGADRVPEGPIAIVAAGKAAAPMMQTAVEKWGARLREALMIGRPLAADALPVEVECIAGGHPLPTAASEQAGRRALAVASSIAHHETLLVLLSGGASSMMAVPPNVPWHLPG